MLKGKIVIHTSCSLHLRTVGTAKPIETKLRIYHARRHTEKHPAFAQALAAEYDNVLQLPPG